MNLDELLDRSAPPVAARTATLHEDLRDLVRTTQPTSARGRRRIATVTLIAAGLVGAGAAGAAAGILPWPTWTTTSSTGSTCQMDFRVHPHHLYGGEEQTRTISRAEENRVAAEARRLLDRIDYNAIDLDAAIRAWRKAEAQAIAGEAPDERQPVMTGDDLTQSAMYYVVTRRVTAELRAEGLDPQAVTFGAGSRCER